MVVGQKKPLLQVVVEQVLFFIKHLNQFLLHLIQLLLGVVELVEQKGFLLHLLLGEVLKEDQVQYSQPQQLVVDMVEFLVHLVQVLMVVLVGLVAVADILVDLVDQQQVVLVVEQTFSHLQQDLEMLVVPVQDHQQLIKVAEAGVEQDPLVQQSHLMELVELVDLVSLCPFLELLLLMVAVVVEEDLMLLPILVLLVLVEQVVEVMVVMALLVEILDRMLSQQLVLVVEEEVDLLILVLDIF